MKRRAIVSLRVTGLGSAAIVLLSGCMTAKLEEDRAMSTKIAAHEAVVLLAKPHVEGVTAEDDFMDCVGDKMAKSKGIKVHANNTFVDSMFPWLETGSAGEELADERERDQHARVRVTCASERDLEASRRLLSSYESQHVQPT